MKYVVLLCDGMADLPRDDLTGKTPMGTAKKPNMDKLAKVSEVGLVKTVIDSLKPGSDVANLSVLGYDPSVYYSGRSPLEAGGRGRDVRTRRTSTTAPAIYPAKRLRSLSNLFKRKWAMRNFPFTAA